MQTAKALPLSTSVFVLQMVVVVFSLAAPIWFAWLSTKQIGQRFRMSEDYAFKAAISSAYEGFRREAAMIDKNMERDLLQSALTRYDELPLRLLGQDNYGSPWHELSSSIPLARALKLIPGFPKVLERYARKHLQRFTERHRGRGQSATPRDIDTGPEPDST